MWGGCAGQSECKPAPPVAPKHRLFLPMGADGAAFRAQGFATVAALAAEDTPQRLRCTHELKGGAAVPILTKD